MPMDPNDPRVQEFVKNSQQTSGKKTPKKKLKRVRGTNPAIEAPHRQRRIFKRKRGGVELTREEVKEIKAGRRKIRKELRAQGIKSRHEFEMTAVSVGLYFDKRERGLLHWMWNHKLGSLLGLLAALLALLFFMSVVTQMQGHFTVNLSDGLFKEGFVLSESPEFTKNTTYLFATPAENIPCISFRQIDLDVDQTDGSHNGLYFAYTFYIRNEGESTQDYVWTLHLNSEGKNLSSALWAMVFEDGVMRFYAKADEDGNAQALPAYGDNSRGYPDMPFGEYAAEPEEQYQLIAQRGERSFYRIVPHIFESDDIIAHGQQSQVAPMDVHKYTVVLWLEGDDPDCTDDLIGGHVGLDFGFRMVTEDAEDKNVWQQLWEELKFWD